MYEIGKSCSNKKIGVIFILIGRTVIYYYVPIGEVPVIYQQGCVKRSNRDSGYSVYIIIIKEGIKVPDFISPLGANYQLAFVAKFYFKVCRTIRPP